MFCTGLICFGRGLIVPSKAYLSVHLLNYAWHKTMAEGPARPWPWMDASPIAQLYIPSQKQNFVILDSISPQALAFSPGWHPQTAKPGQQGVTLFAAHNETHFKSISQLKENDRLTLETKSGERLYYSVISHFISEKPQLSIPSQLKEGSKDLLILSTCHKDNITDISTQKRYILIAQKVTLKHEI